jgi:hypothetical protein
MYIADEISIIDDLMKLDIEEIKSNREIFCNIIEAIELSHTDGGYFELTKENEKPFIDFSRWLNVLKTTINLDLPTVTIENFSITADEFARSMSPYAKPTQGA